MEINKKRQMWAFLPKRLFLHFQNVYLRLFWTTFNSDSSRLWRAVSTCKDNYRLLSREHRIFSWKYKCYAVHIMAVKSLQHRYQTKIFVIIVLKKVFEFWGCWKLGSNYLEVDPLFFKFLKISLKTSTKYI